MLSKFASAPSFDHGVVRIAADFEGVGRAEGCSQQREAPMCERGDGRFQGATAGGELIGLHRGRRGLLDTFDESGRF